MHKNITKTHEFWWRDLWKWVVDLVKDTLLAPQFVWDACRLSKFDGKEYVRFIHEPWTAQRFWDVQVCPSFVCIVNA